MGVVDVGGTSEASDGLGGIFEATLANQPPRRLGGEVHEDGERGGEHPLKGDGDSEYLLAEYRRGDIVDSYL